MPKKKDKSSKKEQYAYTKDERRLMKKRKERFSEMWNKKKLLRIDEKCDYADDLYTPHMTDLNDADKVNSSNSSAFGGDNDIFSEQQRKSMPIVYEKVTTAISVLAKENPRVVMKAFDSQSQEKNEIIKHTYYANYASRNKGEVLKKYIYHLAKYSIAYWRECIMKTYRKQHFEKEVDGKIVTEAKWVYDVHDVVGQIWDPRNVILDDRCYGPKDVMRPANDCVLVDYVSKEEFERLYPENLFEKARYVVEGGAHMLSEHFNRIQEANGKQLIQLLIYENVFENLMEVWANSIPMVSTPLPGDRLSISGEKWMPDKDNYDGIGVAQICALYAPLIDDIVNASNERLRQLVRPNEDWFNGIEQSDESEDQVYGASRVRHFNGAPNDVKYSNPPARTDAEAKEKEEILQELDLNTGLPRTMGGGASKAPTAYQESVQRESALKKLSIPLDAIKKTIEDAANLDIALYPVFYSEPEEVIIASKGDQAFDEGMAIIEQDKKLGIPLEDEERVSIMEKDEEGNITKIGRRKFRTLELPLSAGNEDNGRVKVVESEDRMFWEMVPKHFDWRGKIEVIAESFLPVSKALDDEKKKETIDFLLNVQTTDETGRPVLIDSEGKPFTIDRVKLIKERVKMNNELDPDSIIIPLDQSAMPGQAENPNDPNPLDKTQPISPKALLNMKDETAEPIQEEV